MNGKYTVNEVEERTSVPASTLRQWERRYGFPMPGRSESGYRLYSPEDIALIEAMRRHIEDGVPASRAADLVKRLHAQVVSSLATQAEPKSVETFFEGLLEALVNLDQAQADRILSEAHALHPVETVLLDILQKCIIEIGQLWHDGKIKTTTEHFASNYAQGRLRSLLQLTGGDSIAPAIIVACAPDDQHELGALTLAVLLRRQGFMVYYLGANTPVADLRAMAQDIRPAAVMISATVATSLKRLFENKEHIYGMAPLVIFGGMAFNQQPQAAQELGGYFLSGNTLEALKQLKQLIHGVTA